MAAIAGEPHVSASAPYFGAHQIERAIDHNAGEVASRYAGKRSALHLPLHVLDVTGINAGSHDLDPRFLSCVGQVWDVFHF